MAGGCLYCPQCKTLLMVPAPNVFLRCGICSMLMSIGATDNYQEVKSVIFEDNVPRPSSTGSQSSPRPPSYRAPADSLQPNHIIAPVPQARPVLQAFGSQQSFQARTAANQPPQAPFPAPPGPHFVGQTPLPTPQPSFKPPAALPLAQPAESEEVGTLSVGASSLVIPAPQAPISVPESSLLSGAVTSREPVFRRERNAAGATQSDSVLRPFPTSLALAAPSEDARQHETPLSETRKGAGLSSQDQPVEQEGRLGGTDNTLQIQVLESEQGSEPLRESVPKYSSKASSPSQVEKKAETILQLSPPAKPLSESDSPRPKSSHGSRSPGSSLLLEEPSLVATRPSISQDINQPVPPAFSRSASVSQPTHPPPALRAAEHLSNQPSFARQASMQAQYLQPPGGVPSPQLSLTFTCSRCNNAQMTPPLPAGVHHMKCGTCAHINEVQIGGPVLTPPSQQVVHPPSPQPLVSSPGSYAAPPSPPSSQTMKCGACGSLMMLPPMEPGVHQFQCGVCRAINSCQIQAPAPSVALSSGYAPSNGSGSSGSWGLGSFKEKVKKNLKKHMELQKSGGSGGALFSRPSSGGYPPQYAQPQGYEQAPPSSYHQAPQPSYQPSPQPSYAQPSYQPATQPSYQPSPQPNYPQPTHQPATQATYQPAPQPSYPQPSYQAAPHPSSSQPGYESAPQSSYQAAPQSSYQAAPQSSYQAAPQPSYQAASQPRYPQPTYEPAQTTYQLEPQSSYQPAPQPSVVQAPQVVLQQPPVQTDFQQSGPSVYQQPVSQPANHLGYQELNQPGYQQPAVPAAQPVPLQDQPVQLQYAQQISQQSLQPSNQTQAPQVSQTQLLDPNPASAAGLESYLEAQLHITQSPPSSSGGSACEAKELRTSVSNLSDQSGVSQEASGGILQAERAPSGVENPQASLAASLSPPLSGQPLTQDVQQSPYQTSNTTPVSTASPVYAPTLATSIQAPFSSQPVNPQPVTASHSDTPQQLVSPLPVSPEQRLASPPTYSAQSFQQPGFYSNPSNASSLSSNPASYQPQWPPEPVLAPAAIWVNGQRLTEELTEAAEVLAGPIERGGFYWYDSVAGFWGEYGKPCQGVLPPGIPEFDFPLPANAAGGTTGIYVNGRILAHRDLAMLRQRNFPQKPGKRYTLDIGGTLKDEETGKVVMELGKLAQSVEEAGVGKGMKKAQFAPPPAPVQPKPKKFGGFF